MNLVERLSVCIVLEGFDGASSLTELYTRPIEMLLAQVADDPLLDASVDLHVTSIGELKIRSQGVTPCFHLQEKASVADGIHYFLDDVERTRQERGRMALGMRKPWILGITERPRFETSTTFANALKRLDEWDGLFLPFRLVNTGNASKATVSGSSIMDCQKHQLETLFLDLKRELGRYMWGISSSTHTEEIFAQWRTINPGAAEEDKIDTAAAKGEPHISPELEILTRPQWKPVR